VGDLLVPIIGRGREPMRQKDCGFALLSRAILVVAFNATGRRVILVQRGIHRGGVRRVMLDESGGERQVVPRMSLAFYANQSCKHSHRLLPMSTAEWNPAVRPNEC
jgi:hypothetical protein